MKARIWKSDYRHYWTVGFRWGLHRTESLKDAVALAHYLVWRYRKEYCE